MKSNSTEKFEEELVWILSHIQGSNQQKKMIIYVRSINTCYNMFLWLVSAIEEDFFIHGTPAFQNRRVEMFHANTDEASKTRILGDFTVWKHPGPYFYSCFWMGINLPDVDIVIHWGLPNSSWVTGRKSSDVLGMADRVMQYAMHLNEALRSVAMKVKSVL